jgi:hypothetical protein
VTDNASVVLGVDDIYYDNQHGIRIRSGFRFCEKAWIETNGFALSEESVSLLVGSAGDGSPALVRPLTDTATGVPLLVPVSIPGALTGAVSLRANTRMNGLETNLACCLFSKDHCALNFLIGMRHLYLEEELTILQTSSATTGSSFTFEARDLFESSNRFYGAQIGVAGGAQCGPVYFGATSKIATGLCLSDVNTQGNVRVTTPGLVTEFPGLLSSRPGQLASDQIVFIPETGVELGVQCCKCMNLMIGYNFLYWSKVARPGDNLTNVINSTIRNGELNESSFWIHGLTATIGFRF